MKLKYTICLFILSLSGLANAQYRYAGKVLGFKTQYRPYPESWCAAQALGKPNVYPQYDDISGAWTVKNFGKTRDSLVLGFENNSPIDSVLIWETSGAGIIDSVYIQNQATGKWNLVFGRKGKNPPSKADTLANILRIGFPMTGYNVSAVRIELAADSSKQWPEIDAVAIHPKILTPTTYSNSVGYAAKFDGIDDFYQPNYSTWNLVNHTNFTMMCWVQVNADTAIKVNNLYEGAGVIYDANVNSIGLMHANLGSGDSLYFFTDNSNAEYGIPYTKGNWQHLAAVNTKDSLYIYVNGKLIRTLEGSSYDSLDAYGMIEFGRNYENSYHFKGSIDEVKFFDRALSSAEVLKQKYSIGDAAVNKNLVGYWQFNETSDSAHWNTYSHLTDSLRNGTSYVVSGTILAVKTVVKNTIGVYPNPNNGQFKIRFSETLNGNQLVNILDINGRVVYRKTLNFLDGTATIADTNLKPGIYFLTATGQQCRFIVE